MPLDNVLLIFVKYPEPGFVKTRLAKDIGKNKAALFYRLFAEAILARTEDSRFRRIIFYSPPEKKSEIINWLKTNEVCPQNGDTLGERLSNGFEFAFKSGARKVIAIGTDSPAIDREIILKAFEILEGKQCVIGPALDGGYYLIGMSYFHKDIFRDINWSTPDVLKQTKDSLNKLKLKFAILDKEIDVDSFDDLLVLKDRLKNSYKTNPIGLSPLLNLYKRDSLLYDYTDYKSRLHR